MSKAVKSVGRAIGKVVKGVAKAVKSFAKSKIGRIIITAAAVYFGGAALAGGLGAPAGSGLSGFLQGAGTGISNAAQSLSTAWSSALSGNFAQAGSALSSGFQGQVAGAVAQSGAPVVAGAAEGAGAFTGATSTGLPTVAADAANVANAAGAAKPGIISSAWNSLGDYGKMAAVQGAVKVGGSLMQAKGMADEAVAARERYDRNMGTPLWSSSGAPADSRQYTVNNYDPVAEARAIGERYASQMPPPPPGLIARAGMQPMPTNNNFPVYNPYYYGPPRG